MALKQASQSDNITHGTTAGQCSYMHATAAVRAMTVPARTHHQVCINACHACRITAVLVSHWLELHWTITACDSQTIAAQLQHKGMGGASMQHHLLLACGWAEGMPSMSAAWLCIHVSARQVLVKLLKYGPGGMANLLSRKQIKSVWVATEGIERMGKF